MVGFTNGLIAAAESTILTGGKSSNVITRTAFPESQLRWRSSFGSPLPPRSTRYSG